VETCAGFWLRCCAPRVIGCEVPTSEKKARRYAASSPRNIGCPCPLALMHGARACLLSEPIAGYNRSSE
jgi:hypothetical protein